MAKPDWMTACDLIRDYLGMPAETDGKVESLTQYLIRLEERVAALELQGHKGDDPPPKPPDLGP